MKKTNEHKNYDVLSEKQIVQKMAGYKSAWTKRINAARASAREAVRKQSVVALANIEAEIRSANRKAIQRRAGHLSWITRKANEAAHSVKMNKSVKIMISHNTNKNDFIKPCEKHGAKFKYRPTNKIDSHTCHIHGTVKRSSKRSSHK